MGHYKQKYSWIMLDFGRFICIRWAWSTMINGIQNITIKMENIMEILCGQWWIQLGDNIHDQASFRPGDFLSTFWTENATLHPIINRFAEK